MSKFQVEIDKNACQGFGACVELCPQLFQLSDIDGKSTIEGAKQVLKENEVVVETLEHACMRKAFISNGRNKVT